MRIGVYIDGFNLYYRCLRGTQYKWLDVAALSRAILPHSSEVQLIRYFTADVSPRAGDEGAPERQATYLRALKTIPELSIHKGRFLSKTIKRPMVSNPSEYVEVHTTEEKGSDVNLASFLLMDAFADRFDEALIMSQDTDLLEPLRMVADDLGKPIRLAWSREASPGKKHKAVAKEIHRLTPNTLARCQFEEIVVGRGGGKIVKPDAW